MTTYWSQFDKEELDSMQGIEQENEDDKEMYQEEDDSELGINECPRCCDRGCNYCLCVEW